MRTARAQAGDTDRRPSVPTVDVEEGQTWDLVDEWGLQSFPASDPPANW